MTNEELVLIIKNGNDELLPSLWERVERFAVSKAKIYYNSHSQLCAAVGVVLDDLQQEAYFAFLDAVRYYDPEKDLLFISYMGYPLLNAFNGLCGQRTAKDREDPLSKSKSLNTPIGEDDLTLEDMLEDETAGNAFCNVEELDYTKRLRSDLEQCIDTLNHNQQEVIRCRYFSGMAFRDIAERQNVKEKLCRSRETEALRSLRRGKSLATLQKYRDDIISRYGYNGSFGLWRDSGCSAVEYAVLKREEAAERLAY